MQVQQHTEVLQKRDVVEEVMSTPEIKKKGKREELSDLIQKKYPEQGAAGRATALYNATCRIQIRNILKETMIGRFLSQTAADESDQSLARSEINRRIIFNYSVQPFTFISVSIFESSELQIKCCTLYQFYSSTTFIQYSLFTSTLLLSKTK